MRLLLSTVVQIGELLVFFAAGAMMILVTLVLR